MPFCELNIPSSFPHFPLQQTADNADKVKEIEQRAQSLSGVLASPVREDDHAEKWRRAELQRFVFAQIYSGLLTLFQEARWGCREARTTF